MNADNKEFDLHDAIRRTAESTGKPKKDVEVIVKSFLEETATGLAEQGRIEYHGHFSITLKARQPRKGIFKGKPWSTPKRLEPEFQAAKALRDLVQQAQGIECI